MVGLPTISSASAGLGGTGQLSLPSQAFLALHFLATLRLSLPITGRVLGNLGKHGAELPGMPSRGTSNHLVCE